MVLLVIARKFTDTEVEEAKKKKKTLSRAFENTRLPTWALDILSNTVSDFL